METPPALPPPCKAAASHDTSDVAPPVVVEPDFPEPALAPDVSAQVEALPKPLYKAGDLAREEDYDPSRLPKGYRFEHGRIARTQKSD